MRGVFTIRSNDVSHFLIFKGKSRRERENILTMSVSFLFFS